MFNYMFKHSYAALVKTITIRDDVYRKLAIAKLKDESFSELFERLLSEAGSVEIVAKLRGRVEFSDKAKMLSEIERSRAERRQ